MMKQNVKLAPYTTYQIGGEAEYFCTPSTEAEMMEAVRWAQAQSLSIIILGGGSNILISDDGIKGVVIRPNHENVTIEGSVMRVGASALVKTISEQAFTEELSGLEWAIGIPGFVGGAIRGNAGAHGGSFDQIVERVTVFDSEKLEFREFTPADCHFTYRHSYFKETTRYIIWEVELQLKKGDKKLMNEQMEEYRAYRKNSQPAEPSAGCIFKNLLVKDVEKVNPEVVKIAEADNKIRGGKIGAGYLIQKLGLTGYQVGGAEISAKHANFVVNKGEAKAQDVLKIMKYVQEKIKDIYQIQLEAEVQVVGE